MANDLFDDWIDVKRNLHEAQRMPHISGEESSSNPSASQNH